MINEYQDYCVRATAGDGQVRAFACTTKNLLNTASELHSCSAVAAAALGRTINAAAMMALMMTKKNEVWKLKEDDDRDEHVVEKITINIKSEGPIQGLIVVADAYGNIKGEVYNPNVENFTKNGKLDVGQALWPGVLNVIKDIGLKEPYVGQVPLITGEIGDDFSEYFASSEQIPSMVALGVLVDKDNTILSSGGIIIQLMPDATEEIITSLEKLLEKGYSVSKVLNEGGTPEDMLNYFLGDYDLKILDKNDLKYNCDCSRERFFKGMVSIGKNDLTEILEEDKQAEVECRFCHKKYHFDEEDLRNMINSI